MMMCEQKLKLTRRSDVEFTLLAIQRWKNLPTDEESNRIFVGNDVDERRAYSYVLLASSRYEVTKLRR